MHNVWLFCLVAIIPLQPLHSQPAQQENHTYDELGRLKSTTNSGSTMAGESRSVCYDELGNRTDFEVRNNGTVVSCPAPTNQTPPSGPPDPVAPPIPDPPDNYPPIAVDDLAEGNCGSIGFTDVMLNDSAPEAGEGISLISISFTGGDPSGAANIDAVSGDVVVLYPNSNFQSSFFMYVIEDDAGNQASAELRVRSLGTCDPFGGPLE